METEETPFSVINRWLFAPSPYQKEKFLTMKKKDTLTSFFKREKLAKYYPRLSCYLIDVMFYFYLLLWKGMIIYFFKCYRRCTCPILRYTWNQTPNLTFSVGPPGVVKSSRGRIISQSYLLLVLSFCWIPPHTQVSPPHHPPLWSLCSSPVHLNSFF